MLIEIDKIKVSDRIRKDYGNLQELADDIKENGLINPPVVTPDTYELIAGERRLRAMKLLGYKQIEVRPMAVKDAEHQLNLEISENESRKEFTKTERMDYAIRLGRIMTVKAKEQSLLNLKQNSDSQNSDGRGRVDDSIAAQLGFGSRDTYRKEKYIVENKNYLSPEDFADWDIDKLSTNKAFNKIKAEKEALELKVKDLESREPEVVDNTDYAKVTRLENELEELKIQKRQMETKAALDKQDAEKYKKLKEEIEFLTKQKNDLGRQISSTTELSSLTVTLQHLLETELAPIKFKRCMEWIDYSDVAAKNLSEIIDKIDSWSVEMKNIMGNRYDCVIEVEG